MTKADIRYSEVSEKTFWGHFDVSRLSVPRYQNIFRICIWLFFLGVYSQAVREPLERAHDLHWDGWEIIMYVMALSFLIEDLHSVSPSSSISRSALLTSAKVRVHPPFRNLSRLLLLELCVPHYRRVVTGRIHTAHHWCYGHWRTGNELQTEELPSHQLCCPFDLDE